MKPTDWVRRSARAGRELALRVATRGRGVPLTLNGLPVRVAAEARHRFSADYDRPVAAFLRHRILPGSEVWNVGANVGVYALQLGAWLGPQARVVAFEPNPDAARVLMENVRLNRLHDRVEIIRCAIGETSGEANLYTCGVDGMSRIGRPNPLLAATKAVSVAVTTLDEVAERRQKRPSWVIMDIEGWEIAALKSARRLLRHSRFVIELHPSAWPWSGHSRTDLEELLQELELEVVRLTGQADPLGEHGHVFVDGARGALIARRR
jgi:FkbM family methyltransferase